MDRQVLIASNQREVRARLQAAAGDLGLGVVGLDAAAGLFRSPHLRVLAVDLREPGGMDLLRSVSEVRPDVRVLALGYPGSPQEIEEATRLGVLRFLPDGISPAELRDLVAAGEHPGGRYASSYEAQVGRAKTSLREHQMRAAEAHARRALAIDPDHPEAYNLIGVVRESTAHRSDALKFYRIALELDPAHELAQRNAATAAKPPAQRGPAEFE